MSANVLGQDDQLSISTFRPPAHASINLRGIGSGDTLMLLNGQRVANYAFDGSAVDVNSIPLAAVERIEILKDGASAIYGTDAIAGVVNFILPRISVALRSRATAAGPSRAGASSTRLRWAPASAIS